MRSVRRGDSPSSFRLVSRADGGVLVRIGTPHPLPVFLLLPLHAPVLEPNLDVALSEAKGKRQLHAPRPRDVSVEKELLLEFQQLGARVGRPRAFVFFTLRHHVWSWRQTDSMWNLTHSWFITSSVKIS